MNQEQIMKIAFIASMISALTGALIKIMHIGGISLSAVFAITVVTSLLWIALASIEVFSSKRLHFTEKIMWTVAFLVFSMMAGLLYFFSGRQHVIDRKSLFQKGY